MVYLETRTQNVLQNHASKPRLFNSLVISVDDCTSVFNEYQSHDNHSYYENQVGSLDSLVKIPIINSNSTS